MDREARQRAIKEAAELVRTTENPFLRRAKPSPARSIDEVEREAQEKRMLATYGVRDPWRAELREARELEDEEREARDWRAGVERPEV